MDTEFGFEHPKWGEPAIVVDYYTWSRSKNTRDFVNKRVVGQHPSAHLVMLVDYPDFEDYDPSAPISEDDAEAVMVIRNSKGLPSEEFEEKALKLLITGSTLVPVVSVSTDWGRTKKFMQAGVTVTLHRNGLTDQLSKTELGY